MGKKAKQCKQAYQQRDVCGGQTAQSPTGEQSHDPTTPNTPVRNDLTQRQQLRQHKPPTRTPKPDDPPYRGPRDPVTGVALGNPTTGAPFDTTRHPGGLMRVTTQRVDYQVTRQEHADGWQSTVTDIPYALHVHQTAPGGLGGKQWSYPFTSYIGHLVPVAITQAYNEAYHWWESEYGRQRVYRGFIGGMGAERGQVAYAVAYGMARWPAQQRPYAREQFAHATGAPVWWVKRMESAAARFGL